MIAPFQDIIIIALAGLVLLLLIWTIAQQVSLSRLKKNQRQLFQGKTAQSLEDILMHNNARIAGMDKDIKDLYEISSKIHALSHKSIHRVGMIRFNPFRDLGGDQSFSLALLDGDNNGVVLSSLYSRDGVRVYAKALVAGLSEKYPLTEEEKQAIATASVQKGMQLQKISK